MKHTGLRKENANLLTVLANQDSATNASLAETLGVALGSVKRQLSRLAKLNYVDANLAPVGVAMHYFITESGRLALGIYETREAHHEDDEDDSIDEFPRPDSDLIVLKAIQSQPTSVFDLARVMQR